MTGLWLGIAALTLLAMAFVFLPFVRARAHQPAMDEDRRQQNIAIFKDRLAELEQERFNGTLDDDAFAQLKLELEKNLLGDVVETKQPQTLLAGRSQLMTVALLAVISATAAIAMYLELGSYRELEIAQQRTEMREQGRTPTLEEAIATLQDELEVRPDNPEGWYMLATTFLNMGRFEEGAQALEQVLETLPQEAPQYPGIMGQYAQAQYFVLGNKITPALQAHIDKTLQMAPNEMTTLGLLGIDSFEQQQYQKALEYWSRALQNAEGPAAQSLQEGIRKAKQALEDQGINVTLPDLPNVVQLEIEVSLSDALKGRVTPDQTVFVFARPVGGRMPLAAVRLTVAELPAKVILDDSQAMMPEARLSSVETVEVNAKVSMSGTPAASPGDLFGQLVPVNVNDNSAVLSLVIDQVIE